MPTLERPTVSVIIPTLNEAKNLPLVFPYLPHELIDEVILVDGHSTDDTIAMAQRLLPDIKVVVQPGKGKGAALRAGYAAATGEIVVVIDADGSNDPRELPRFIQALIEGSDFVKGSRFAPTGGTTDMPRFRQLGNWAFVTLVNILFDMHFTDLCYGYHAFWRYCLKMIDLNGIDGFEIDTAIYLRAARQHLRITEVPSFEGYRFHGVGKLQTIPDGWRVLTTIVREWRLNVWEPVREFHLGFRGLMPILNNPLNFAPALETASQANYATARQVYEGDSSEETVQRVHQALEMLYDPQGAPEDGLVEKLEELLQPAVESVNASSGSILMLDDRGEVKGGCLQYRGRVRPLTPDKTDFVQRGLAGWIAEHRQSALITSTQDDPRWLCRAWEEPGNVPRSAIGVPLIHDQRLVGVMTVARTARPFTKNELTWLAGLTVAA